MDFNLSNEHKLIRKMMAEFTEDVIKPITAETDRTAEYPRETIEKLFDLGIMGMCVPEEYGGAGSDPLASAIAIEEIAKHPQPISLQHITDFAVIPYLLTVRRNRRQNTFLCSPRATRSVHSALLSPMQALTHPRDRLNAYLRGIIT